MAPEKMVCPGGQPTGVAGETLVSDRGTGALGISLQDMRGVNWKRFHFTMHLQAQQDVLLVRIRLFCTKNHHHPPTQKKQSQPLGE